MSAGVGIVAIGVFLPEHVRPNSWWAPEMVEQWMHARRNAPALPVPSTRNMQRVMEAMSRQAVDPFQGVSERRVMDPTMESLDMEVAAAEQAIARAGIDRNEIDCVLTQTAVPEYLLGNPACELHQRLGLPARCFSMQADASGFSFVMQLSLAEQFILLGRARYVLCVQSCAASRLIDPADPHSPLLGDGAAAVLVGRVNGAEVIASAVRTDGTRPRVLVGTVPGARWYDPGRVTLHRANPAHAIGTFLETIDRAQEVVEEVLAKAGVSAGSISFFGGHQATPWLRELIHEATGLTNARTVDVFATTGYMVGVSIPVVLETAVRTSMLAPGDLVMLFGGGVGASYGATLMRWGSSP